ncbi:hypothetical protein VM1G_02072 [Cytospora mali]|uniref:Uncharacterized protein n=1 Tax=Cytospora mali TaxID=578113 RepID=A0A194VQ96_CYTMA|nr:hypothetical protein VM1G_02072 [Valsa mali]
MCFSEFIGYTCGHSSSEVLRPCPMTTQLYTNPLCGRYARRPILAPKMCPACQRVLHGRAVLIVEWEHRWMHERGVCGCEVQFPDLFRPRVVGRNQPFEKTRENIPRANDNTGNGTGNRNGEVKIALSKMGGNNKTGAKNVPALYQETITTTMPGGNKKPEVSIRIPSFYGAEWVDEHRQLHIKGSCKCSGDFSFYQTPADYQVVPSSSVRTSREQVVQTGGPKRVQGQGFKNGALYSYTDQHKFANLRPSPMGYHTYKGAQSQGGHPPRHASSGQVHTNQAQHQHLSLLPGTQKNIKTPYFPGQPSHMSRSATGPSIPRRSPGAIYEVDPAKSTNKLYNFACNEGAKITSCADFQSVEFPKSKDLLPLVGLPIGAGPEGPTGLTHTGDFSQCVLVVKELISALGEPRLLRHKSRSFSCLYELKMARKRCGPKMHSQSASCSAETSPSQSANSSAQGSDNGDGSSREDQL